MSQSTTSGRTTNWREPQPFTTGTAALEGAAVCCGRYLCWACGTPIDSPAFVKRRYGREDYGLYHQHCSAPGGQR